MIIGACYSLFSICYICELLLREDQTILHIKMKRKAGLPPSHMFRKTPPIKHYHDVNTKHVVILDRYLAIQNKVQKNITNSGEDNSNNTLSFLVTWSFALPSLQLFNLHKQNAQNQTY